MVRSPVDILVVDDRPEQRLALTTVLTELGENVVEAQSGRDALRWLLRRDFAVILLDVHMPGMDGFETAALIRQRKRSERTPIIFITAYSDDTHASRGYSLGAVDYILAPIDPDVLRTKVTVFVDLFRKAGEVARQAELMRRHAAQLRRLGDASLAIHSCRSLDELLETAADAACEVLEADQVSLEATFEALPELGRASGPRRVAVRRPAETRLSELGRRVLAGRPPSPVRMTQAEVAALPAWQQLGGADGRPPLWGWLAAPLPGCDGRSSGWIQLSHKRDGEFTPDDEALLSQLARIVSLAIENTLLSSAQEANRLKDEFLATLSHELRTPLQSMMSWTSLLRDEHLDEATHRRGLEVIERSARVQTKLIDDLLEVSRIVTGKLRLEWRTLDLEEVVEVAVDAARPAAQEKELSIDWLPASTRLLARGDGGRLQQVITNLLSNAIKFTPPRGRVEVSLLRIGETAEIRIADSGIGIRTELLPHIFERFRQGDSSSTRSHGGLGIGLAIVKHLVDLHGGGVRAESAGEGRGSTFSVMLPLEEGAEPVQAATESLLIAGGKSGAAALTEARLDGIRVLLVDDEEDARDCVALALQRRGAEVCAVASAAEALAALERRAAHVVLSDIAMPGEDGFHLIAQIRKRDSERGAHTPAAALSAYARPDETRRALGAGFDLHLAKPVEEGLLVEGVRHLAGRGGRLQAR